MAEMTSDKTTEPQPANTTGGSFRKFSDFPDARRILVIGCSGSGKSTLSRKLAKRSGLPLVHLDQYYHGPDWAEPKQADWEAKVNQLIAEDSWIMDGSYTGSLAMRAARADLIIYLDLPTWMCLSRVIRRTLLYRGSVRPDAAEGCKERFDWQFFKYILHYKQNFGPKIQQRLQDYRDAGGPVVRLGTIKSINSFAGS